MWVTGCATQSPASGAGRTLRHSQRQDAASLEPSRNGLADDSSPRRSSAQERRQRPHEHETEDIADRQQRATETRQAVIEAADEVKRSTEGLASDILKLAAHTQELGGNADVFSGYFDYGSNQIPWLYGALRGTTTLVEVSESVDDPDMAVATGDLDESGLENGIG